MELPSITCPLCLPQALAGGAIIYGICYICVLLGSEVHRRKAEYEERNRKDNTGVPPKWEKNYVSITMITLGTAHLQKHVLWKTHFENPVKLIDFIQTTGRPPGVVAQSWERAAGREG